MNLLLGLFLSISSVSALVPLSSAISNGRRKNMALASSSVSADNSAFTQETNTAKYLVDLHESKATFDFCGGMIFQLVLSDKLRAHLLQEKELQVFGADEPRMHLIPGYQKTAQADNKRIFHGREIRQVSDAAGGMGFVLQLSLADGKDPEGWTSAEIEGYDGWGHDSGRTWRKGDRLEEEGFVGFRERFGPSAFALHHRFYLHLDRGNRLWLAAEDGCEGTPAAESSNPFFKLQ